MSLERRKPFSVVHPNAKPTDPVLAPHSAPPHPAISRPRRQMQQYHHHQPHHHKRYGTLLPGSSRSSATSSAESVYSTTNSLPPRRRKLSAAEDVAARVRARWAALQALESTSGGAPGSMANPADTISATNNTNTAAATATTGAATPSNTATRSGTRIRIDSQTSPGWQQHNWAGLEPRERERDHALLLEMGKERDKENENERSMSMAMQVDGHEKPLPPRPAPLALALHLNPGQQGPLSAPAHMSTTPTMAMTMTPMAVDDATHEGDNKNGSSPREDDDAGAGDSTLRTTPTSLTCYETTESHRQVLHRRPTRALTPPQVRRRPSITDELEEAVCTVPLFPKHFFQNSLFMHMFFFFVFWLEGRSHFDHAPNFPHGRSITLSTARMQRAPERRTRAYIPPTHPRRRSRRICMRAMRRCV